MCGVANIEMEFQHVVVRVMHIFVNTHISKLNTNMSSLLYFDILGWSSGVWAQECVCVSTLLC